MNPLSTETSLVALILAYVFMGCIFVSSQRQDMAFVDSFDRALVMGGYFFIGEYGVDAVVYVAWA